MPSMKMEDYLAWAKGKAISFIRIAKVLGPEHEMTMLMGQLAWGRYEAEPGGYPKLADAIRADAFLSGVQWTLVKWANLHDKKALDVLVKQFAERGVS